MRAGRLAALAALALAAGCTANGPPLEALDAPPPGQARVYVYRLEPGRRGGVDVLGSPVWIRFLLDKTSLARIRPGGYVTVVLPPGTHYVDAEIEGALGVPEDAGSETIQLAAGETMYCAHVSWFDARLQRQRDFVCSQDASKHTALLSSREEALATEPAWKR